MLGNHRDAASRPGNIIAIDVKAPSLFGELSRIIDKNEAVKLLSATLPTSPPSIRMRIRVCIIR
jgi:hypothetical protein